MAERHVAVIPFPITSHPKSLLNIVIRLARSSPNTRFSFLTTSKCNASLFKSSSTDNDPPPTNIKPYDIADGLPDGYVPAAYGELDVDIRAVNLFLGAFSSPAGKLTRALDAAVDGAGMNISCIIVDALLSSFAAEVGIPWISVWSPSPLCLFTCLHAVIHRRGDTDALEFFPALPGLARVFDYWPSDRISAESPLMKALRELVDVLPRASAVVLNSFREMYPEIINLDLESRVRTSVLNVGFHTVSVPILDQSPDLDPSGCLAWLDGKKPNSIAYISFGTVIGFSDDELTAMAEALEEKGSVIPFLWSLPDHQKRRLPIGFVERTERFGKIVAWTNQVQVLGHGSIGVHVTHCGCNSVNESIANGVPIIGRPVWTDNHVNAMMVESAWEIGVGLEGAAFTKRGFMDALEMVMEREQGTKMRERALELQKLALECSGPVGSGTQDFNALLSLVNAQSCG